MANGLTQKTVAPPLRCATQGRIHLPYPAAATGMMPIAFFKLS